MARAGSAVQGGNRSASSLAEGGAGLVCSLGVGARCVAEAAIGIECHAAMLRAGHQHRLHAGAHANLVIRCHFDAHRRVFCRACGIVVRQQIAGLLRTALYAVCWLMHEAASKYRLLLRKLSFTEHVQLLRRTQPVPGFFLPARPKLRKRWFDDLLQEASDLRAVSG